MESLASKKCVPCMGGVPPLDRSKVDELHGEVIDWQVVSYKKLRRSYDFPDFRTALDFVNRVGEIAEAEGHHPDILLGYGKVEISIWTHKIDGLTESDFILAAKIDQLDNAAS